MKFFSIDLGMDFSAVIDPNLGKELDPKGKKKIFKPTTILKPKPIYVVR